MDKTRPFKSNISSLRRKVLIPFFVILTSLGVSATLGSLYVINNSLTKTADERLTAFQQQIYREIRHLETELFDKAKLLELSYHIDNASIAHDSEIVAIDQLIDETLTHENMQARFVAPEVINQFQNQTLSEMFSQAKASRKARIRFTTDLGPDPSLSLVAPILLKGEISQYILLQAPVNQTYLKEIADPLRLKISLLSIAGEPLVKSHQDAVQHALSEAVMQDILSGQLHFTTDSSLLSNRLLFNIIPLGTTDLLMLSIELPMTDIENLINVFYTRTAVTMTIALLIGAYIYFRLVSRITNPVEDMLAATHSISEGNLDYRLNVEQAGEFDQLANAFNDMMTSLSTVYDDRIDQERELTIAQEELRYKALLEEKNAEIETANRELGEQNKELSALLQINREMSTTLDLNTLFDKILSALMEIVDCQTIVLLMYNHGEEVLQVSHTIGIVKEELSDITFKLNEGISGETARTRTTSYVPDLKLDKRYLSYKKTLTVFGAMLSIPLVTHDKLCGVLNLHKDKIASFNDDEITLSTSVASQAAVAIENAQLYKQAKELSVTDELTGLANRRHFQDILDREVVLTKRYSTSLSLIMIDIDHFKKYNDFHGHLQGDIVLKKVANALLNNTRGIDLVSRFGGEEFIILLPKTTTAGALIAAEKLRQVIEYDHFEGEEDSQPGGKLTLSLGIASFPDDTSDIQTLQEMADQALYAAKELGRNRCIAYSATKQKT